MKNTVKNAVLVMMAALFIACMGGVFVSIAALMVGNEPVMVMAVITIAVTAPALMVLTHTCLMPWTNRKTQGRKPFS